MAEDLAFEFNPKSVTDGVAKINKSLNGMESGFRESSKGIGKSIQGAMIKAQLLVSILGSAMKGALNTIKQTAPEIGQSFSIAKDIFFKNFLFPLRKSLMPILQQFLDWVRDNRARFVQWGQTLVGIFKTVIKVVGWFINVLKSIGNNILDWLGFDSIQELINIIQFKVAVVIIAIKSLATQTALYLSGLWGQVGDESAELMTNLLDNLTMVGVDILDWAKSFSEGFNENFNLADSIETIIDLFARLQETFGNLWDSLFGGEKGDKWDMFFNGLGDLAGGSLTLLVEGFGALYRVLLNLIDNVIDTPFFDKITEFFALWAEQTGKDMGKIGSLFGDWGDGLSEIGRRDDDSDNSSSGGSGGVRSIDDAIVKPDGSIIRTNPNDTIIATQGTITNNSGGNSSFVVNPTIYLSGSATEADGQAVATGLMDGLRSQFNSEFERGGY